MSSDPIEVLRRIVELARRHEGHDPQLREALASLSAPKPESAEAVGEPIEDGAETEEDSPYLRLFVRPRNLPAGVEALRDLRDRVIPAALRHYASGPGYIEEAQEIVSRALVSLSAPKPESAEAAGEVLRSEDGVARVAMFDDSLRPGTKVYTAPPRPEASAPVGVEAIIEAFDEITGLCRHLRQGGPAPEDLHDLSGALDEAIGIAGNMLDALAQQPAADGGFTAADMMDARQEGRKEAQQPAAVDQAMVERVTNAVVGWATLPGDLPAEPEKVAELREVISTALVGQQQGGPQE